MNQLPLKTMPCVHHHIKGEILEIITEKNLLFHETKNSKIWIFGVILFFFFFSSNQEINFPKRSPRFENVINDGTEQQTTHDTKPEWRILHTLYQEKTHNTCKTTKIHREWVDKPIRWDSREIEVGLCEIIKSADPISNEFNTINLKRRHW